jgi:hypothetical protein
MMEKVFPRFQLMIGCSPLLLNSMLRSQVTSMWCIKQTWQTAQTIQTRPKNGFSTRQTMHQRNWAANSNQPGLWPEHQIPLDTWSWIPFMLQASLTWLWPAMTSALDLHTDICLRFVWTIYTHPVPINQGPEDVDKLSSLPIMDTMDFRSEPHTWITWAYANAKTKSIQVVLSLLPNFQTDTPEALDSFLRASLINQSGSLQETAQDCWIQ